MIAGKYSLKDFEKLLKLATSSRFAHQLTISIEGSTIKVSFEDSNQKLTTVSIFDTSTQILPTVTKTEPL